MARIAATGEKGIEVSDIEVRRGGISYTVDTLAELAGDRPRVELFFVIGEDTIPELPYWKDAARILALARVVAVNRPGHHRSFEAALFPGVPASTLARCEGDRVTMEPAPIASRDVRRAIAAGEPFDHWLPAGVGEYIRRHRLYGYPGTGTGTGPGAATTSEGQGGNQ
jgi:nicotinate-nucleotide adenylyltransferase